MWVIVLCAHRQWDQDLCPVHELAFWNKLPMEAALIQGWGKDWLVLPQLDIPDFVDLPFLSSGWRGWGWVGGR